MNFEAPFMRKLAVLKSRQTRVQEQIETVFNYRLSVAVIAAFTLLTIALNIFVNVASVTAFVTVGLFLYLVRVSRRLHNFSQSLFLLENCYVKQKERIPGLPPTT